MLNNANEYPQEYYDFIGSILGNDAFSFHKNEPNNSRQEFLMWEKLSEADRDNCVQWQFLPCQYVALDYQTNLIYAGRIQPADDYHVPTYTQLLAMQYNIYTQGYNIPINKEAKIATIKQILSYAQDHKIQSPSFADLFLSDVSENTVLLTKAAKLTIATKLLYPSESKLSKLDRGVKLGFILKTPLNQSPFFRHADGNFHFEYENIANYAHYCNPVITAHEKKERINSGKKNDFCIITEIEIAEDFMF
jgi:hypothetical protein